MSTPFQLFPALEPAVEAALRVSIQRWGVIVPVVVDQHGRIIDGHHRRRIAVELGVDYDEQIREVANAQEARELALTLNADRRHLEPDRRREIVAELRADGHSLRAIGGALGVSHQQVKRDLDAAAEHCNGGDNAQPERIRTTDGRTYPATRPTPEPEPDDEDDSDPLFAPGELEAINDTLHEEHGDELEPEHVAQALDENLESKRTPRPAPRPPAAPAPAPPAASPAPEPEPEPEQKPEWQPNKPDLGGGISHPARYSTELLPLFAAILTAYSHPGAEILDPFAGAGGIHELEHHGYRTTGVELEPEWANLHERTLVGSALELPHADETFDAIVTSPTYGNRLADSHNASDPESRRSYTHDLGRPLHDANTGDVHWRTTGIGTADAGSIDYRAMHLAAWREALRVLRPGGLFVLNCCDHVRGDLVQPVTTWHAWALGRLGLDWLESRSVPTRKLRQGANANLREQERLHVFRKGEP